MTRILFVDDEPIVLRALDRSIRAKRRSWEASFVNSGADALELLARESFDVIVSDICMPAMDGVTLLANVRAQFPHMARLALSGEARTADRMRAAHAIHQWLAKPCTLSRLGETIDQLRWGRELVDDLAIVGLVRGLASVPSAPAVCLQVAEALERHAKLDEIAGVIERDPACASKLLQLVNTGFFAEPERVTSVARAAGILGIDRLRELLLASELFRSSVKAEAVTTRGIRVASIAKALATEDPGEVFLAGLLHDVGSLALEGRADAPEATYRARLGGLLLSTWGLPIEIARLVAFHADPEAAPDPNDRQLCVVALAAVLADPASPITLVERRMHALGLPLEVCQEVARATA